MASTLGSITHTQLDMVLPSCPDNHGLDQVGSESAAPLADCSIMASKTA